MILTIREDIPIKFGLNMHLMESFLDKDSISFEIVKYVINGVESSDKEMSIDNLKFTSKTLKYIFGDSMKVETFKDYVISCLKNLIANKLIIPSGKSMNLSSELVETYYKNN